MLTFSHEKGTFNCRAAALIFNQEKLLLHTSNRDDFWSLPGGRVEFGEASEDTLVREMREEIGEAVNPGSLIWLVENFYTWADCPYHEICFYYSCSLPENSRLLSLEEWAGRDGDLELSFRWFRHSELHGVTVYPSFIPEKAFTPDLVNSHIERFVWRE